MPPIVLQVGEGRFLRAFFGALVQEARDRGAAVPEVLLVAPRPSGSAHLAQLRDRGGRYRVVVRGPGTEDVAQIAPYARIIDQFQQEPALLRELTAPRPLVVLSNVTEAGLAYHAEERTGAQTYPARLTRWLEARLQARVADPVAVVPCELLSENAAVLAQSVRRHAQAWGLPVAELLAPVTFVETLVDRIVTSEDPDDALACFTEPYMAFYLGGAPAWLREALPLSPQAVHWVDDVTPARQRKVRLLNGTHTLMAVLGLQLGLRTVEDALGDPDLGPFLRAAMCEDAIGSFAAADRPAAQVFAQETLARLANPGIRDTLARLALQLTAKVAARWGPIFEGCRVQSGQYPERFALGLAAYLRLLLLPEAEAGIDLPAVDNAAWIAGLRALGRQRPPGEFVALAAALPDWPAPRAPHLLHRVAAHLETCERRGLRACLALL